MTVAPARPATALPSWTAVPVDGTGVHTEPLHGVAAAAAAVRTPEPLALLAAHLRVVGLLSGETGVAARTAGGVAAVELDGGSWRDLARLVGEGEDSGLSARPGVVCEHPGLTARYTGGGLRLEYDRRRFDAAHAARFGGYVAAALAAMAGGPDTPYLRCDLLPPAERAHLLHGLRGPTRPLPDQRFHELFAAVAASRPEATAIVHNGRTFGYGWLDRTADRIAHTLLGRGLAGEDVVAVCAPRGPRWLAAIIGILRAGGAYLPVEPDWPAARIAALLERSGCGLVLARPGTAAPRAQLVSLDDAAGPGPDRGPGDPGIPVGTIGPERLAYLYFTSGSTGQPKGAMCEHAGLLNHLLAKIEDLGLGEDDVVVQNAQASFDISLWQAVAPLLVGARTVIVDRDDILDVRRFLDTITGAGATVLQVVPSYLDVLLRHTGSNPGALGRVRTVSVTGEAVGRPLVTRFFAQHHGLALVNAYGATEASDDTTHEIMTAVPAQELVPVGRPVRNVAVTVLGPGDTLVPPGAPGEITFSGVCVGRGYVNDPQRSAAAFGPDPHRPGERMYRTGDFGRWLPTGHLEFHGRRDEQVKVHGVRIELGEVEARILEHPRVRTASVVTTPLPGGGKDLAGFYVSGCGLTPEELAAHLRTVLPAAAVPARLHAVDALPLTGNGKVDKRALTARAAEQAAQAVAVATTVPATPTERRIAAAWAAALGRPPDSVGRHDHFFDLGGSSLSALRAVAALDGLVTLDGLLRAPVLADLAAMIDGAAGGATGGSPGVLRLLGPHGTGSAPRLALVCVPYAAGTAVAFQPLAAAVARADPSIAVYGVQPPGHDPANRGEPPLELDELAKLVTEEALALGLPVALLGHCAGVPLALECALRLGPAARHVFVAARLPVPDRELVREIAAVVAAPDAELGARLAAELAAQGASDGTAPPAQAPAGADPAFVGRAYRHDTRCANQYLLDAPARWAGRTLSCPITVVAATDDPSTGGHRDGYAGWRAFGADVTLAEVDGGHLFVASRPAEIAALVLRAVRGGDP